ncbi:MAG: DUF4387 domain-containing protein [Eubacteriales bacterium]|jgi:hypothetical protein|nr:DUF4387 domain-containing protein [Eubacteriales bacterium]
MKNVPITELAHVIRSKNSGPFELTFDIIFKDDQSFDLAIKSGVFTPQLFAGLYKIPVDKVLGVIEYPPARAIKATIARIRPAGSLGETDVYGAQQHAPLLTINVPVE